MDRPVAKKKIRWCIPPERRRVEVWGIPCIHEGGLPGEGQHGSKKRLRLWHTEFHRVREKVLLTTDGWGSREHKIRLLTKRRKLLHLSKKKKKKKRLHFSKERKPLRTSV